LLIELMNRFHRWLCGSGHWRKHLERNVIPWVLNGVDIGEHLLEIGPGPGLSTDLLRSRSRRVTAIELDEALANCLARRLRDTNVTVVRGDATEMPFRDRQFSGAVSFTMLHHVPSPSLQNKLLREVWRVLKPGGWFAGTDSLQNWVMRLIHIGDSLVPVNLNTLRTRLEAAGFERIKIETNTRAFRFCAGRPQKGITIMSSPPLSAA
jgi:ubiquinone/menaquinone biosynthesis C-methylase UbiE